MGRVLVRNPGTGKALLCCWGPCERLGDERVKAVMQDGFLTEADGAPPLLVGTPKTLTYIFCSERCRAYWAHGPTELGNLPPGLR